MEIIKKGTKQKILQEECKVCGCLFRFFEYEMTEETDFISRVCIAKITCPQCENEIIIRKMKI